MVHQTDGWDISYAHASGVRWGLPCISMRGRSDCALSPMYVVAGFWIVVQVTIKTR